MNGINDICKQTLKLTAENAEHTHNRYSEEFGCEYEIDKQSILNTINQIE